MKPRRIILIRHGECHANTDESQFATEPDYTIELTPKGIEQAQAAGASLKALVGDETLYFYVSPFWRTRSTFEHIAKEFPRKQFTYNEEPRLREQEWGYLRTYAELQHLKEERRRYLLLPFSRRRSRNRRLRPHQRPTRLPAPGLLPSRLPAKLCTHYPFAGHPPVYHALVPPHRRRV